jgi:predicted small secreted protein
MSTFRLWLTFTMLAIGATTLSACNTWEGVNDDASAGTDAAAGDDDDFDADNDDDDDN